jgi:hypothetical protein
VDFVDEQSSIRGVLQTPVDGLQAFLEIAAIAFRRAMRPCRANKLLHRQTARRALHDFPGQTFSDSGLTHAGITTNGGLFFRRRLKRHLDRPLDFQLAADQGSMCFPFQFLFKSTVYLAALSRFSGRSSGRWSASPEAIVVIDPCTGR